METLIKLHLEQFGVEPIIIGKFWNSQDAIMDNIEEALEKNIPYDEHNYLSDEEKIEFDEGNLLF